MFECPGCGLIWRQEFDIGPEFYEDKLIELSALKIKARISNCLDRTKIISRYFLPEDLCDIGCGEGVFLGVLKNQGFRNIVGIDPTTRNFQFAGENNLEILRGTLEDFPSLVAGRGIKIITMFHVIEHLRDPQGSLSLVYKYLPIGGFLVLETPASDNFSFRVTGFRHKLIYPEHLFYFNKHNLIKLLESVGFTVVGSGKRDFDQWNLSLHECLFRLGLLSKNVTTTDYYSSLRVLAPKENIHPKTNYQFVKKVAHFILWPLQKSLNGLVILLGRLDYIYIIAKK